MTLLYSKVLKDSFDDSDVRGWIAWKGGWIAAASDIGWTKPQELPKHTIVSEAPGKPAIRATQWICLFDKGHFIGWRATLNGLKYTVYWIDYTLEVTSSHSKLLKFSESF